jgi:hypothetical protein
VLVSLPDGRTITDVRLKEEEKRSLSEITLLRSGDQYFLITHGNRTPLSIGSVPNVPSKLVMQGNLYALDRQGRLQWPAPAVIKNQYLLLHPPACLPILSFVCHSYQQQLNGMEPKTTVLCIDKRNGRTAYAAKFNDVTSVFVITGDAEKKTVDLAMQGETVTLKFTDNPIPSSSAAGKSAEPPAGGRTVRAIWDSLQKTFGRIMDGSNQDSDQ